MADQIIPSSSGPDEQNSEINRIIGSSLVEIGYGFTTYAKKKLDEKLKETNTLLRYWTIPFNRKRAVNENESLDETVSVQFFLIADDIRLWTNINTNRKLELLEVVSICNTIRNETYFVRAGIDSHIPNTLTLEADIFAGSRENISAPAIRSAITNLLKAAEKILSTYNDFRPIQADQKIS